MVVERVTPSTDRKKHTWHFPDRSEAIHGGSKAVHGLFPAVHVFIIKPCLAFIIINNGESRKLV